MKKTHGLFCFLACIVGIMICVATVSAQPKVGDIFPAWEAGYLDIHHINTGKGECAFFLLPDGTTMLVDAGASNRTERVTPAKPDNSRTPGEWITRYILHMMRQIPEKKLNYIMLTHFHDDHMGALSPDTKKQEQGDFLLSGITEVGENLPFDKIVDRNWPDYNWPNPLVSGIIQNYRRFVEWKIAHNGVIAEQFRVGANDQFQLVRHPEQYPDFEIRNIAANGHVWTGTGNNARNHFPPLESLSKEDIPDENQNSSAIRLSYGKFNYFNGGDITNANAPGHWRDIETPIGMVTGPVDVCVANHHANYDVMGVNFLSAVRPKVIIIPVYAPSQPDNSALGRMLSKRTYPGDRDIFATNLMDETKVVVGGSLNQLKSQQGHIVVRVNPGGNDYMIYILDDSSESFKIKSIHGPYVCD